MNNLIVIVIIILIVIVNMFLNYVLWFISNIINILMINIISGQQKLTKKNCLCFLFALSFFIEWALKTFISSFKMSTETIPRSEYTQSYAFNTFKTQSLKYTEYLQT